MKPIFDFPQKNFNKVYIILEDSFQIIDFNTIPQKIIFNNNLLIFEGDKNIHSAQYIRKLELQFNYDSFSNP